MLKTALKPRWIAGLLFALAISTVFVLLSEWQFSAAESEGPPPAEDTEVVRPLTEVFTPGGPLYGTQADQMVTFSGSFDPEDQVLIDNRLLDGKEGYWVVTAFDVDGAPQDASIPVVRGWAEEADDAGTAPEGDVTITGRLLPPEAPVAGPVPAGTVAALSSAELGNIWDKPLYSAFVTAHETTVDGTPADTGLQTVTVDPQPQETTINWLNIFYAVEWVVFAGFSVFLWWRLLADSYQRSLEEDEYEDDDDEDDDEYDEEPGTTSSEVKN